MLQQRHASLFRFFADAAVNNFELALWSIESLESTKQLGLFPDQNGVSKYQIHSRSLAFTRIHSHSLAFTRIHSHSLAFTRVHSRSLALCVDDAERCLSQAVERAC